MKKKIFSCMIFCLILLFVLVRISEVLLPKSINRYYMLEQKLEELDEEYDVMIFGSCHAYTSFNPMYLIENYGITAYNVSNAGETIAATYLRMIDHFKKDTPEVALVEIWGINPWETYSPTDSNLGFYLYENTELLPMSIAKLEVILDYGMATRMAGGIISIGAYKDRIMETSLTDIDFDYSFEGTKPYSSEHVYSEMENRFAHNGFKAYESNPVPDYEQQQSKIEEGESLALEDDIIKYLNKVIALCEENDVELIFYRAPYRSRANELRKLNWFTDFCEEKGIPFIDLEQDIKFNYDTDFYDYEHLSETGAMKSTVYLTDCILEVMEK